MPQANFGGALSTVDLFIADILFECVRDGWGTVNRDCSLLPEVTILDLHVYINPSVTGIIDPVYTVELGSNVRLEVRSSTLSDAARITSTSDENETSLLVREHLPKVNFRGVRFGSIEISRKVNWWGWPVRPPSI